MSSVGSHTERIEYLQKHSKKIPKFVFCSKVKDELTEYEQEYGKIL